MNHDEFDRHIEESASKIHTWPSWKHHMLDGNKMTQVHAHWECIVEEIDDEEVTLRSCDLLRENPDTESMVIPIKHISIERGQELELGTALDWIIGTTKKDKTFSAETSFSRITVRPMPVWTEEKLETIKERGQEMFDDFMGNK